jgi:hypothetical protein
MWRRRSKKASAARRAGKGLGVLVAAAALHKASDKVQLLRAKKKAQKLGVGDERLDMKK